MSKSPLHYTAYIGFCLLSPTHLARVAMGWVSLLESRLLLKSLDLWQSTPTLSLRASRKTCAAIQKFPHIAERLMGWVFLDSTSTKTPPRHC
ncbi:hypothetical protein [Helicobacter sp. T3_23-1056]